MNCYWSSPTTALFETPSANHDRHTVDTELPTRTTELGASLTSHHPCYVQVPVGLIIVLSRTTARRIIVPRNRRLGVTYCFSFFLFSIVCFWICLLFHVKDMYDCLWLFWISPCYDMYDCLFSFAWIIWRRATNAATRSTELGASLPMNAIVCTIAP